MTRFIVGLLALCLLVAPPAWTQSEEEIETRTDAISKTLRCVVCYNTQRPENTKTNSIVKPSEKEIESNDVLQQQPTSPRI